jgi:hypothetical protein
VTSACALIVRQSGKRGTLSLLENLFDKRCRIDGREQAATLEIVADNRGDIPPGIAFRRPAGQEIRQCDRHRLHVALIDIDVENGARRTRTYGRQRTRTNQHAATAYFEKELSVTRFHCLAGRS